MEEQYRFKEEKEEIDIDELQLENDINESFNTLNSVLLPKNYLIALLLIESFSIELCQREIRVEVLDFLTKAFNHLSIPIKILNYLILNVNNKTQQQHSEQQPPTTTINSYKQQQQTNSNKTVIGGVYTTTTTTTTNHFTNQTTSDIINELLPSRVNKELLNDLEYTLDYNYHQDLTLFQSQLSKLKSLEEKGLLFRTFLLNMLNKSSIVFPSKYSHLITSQNYLHTFHQCLEYYIIQNIFHNVFPIDFDKDTLFTKRIETLSFIEPIHLGLDSNSDCHLLIEHSKKYLLKLNSYQTPMEKKRCISKSMIQLSVNLRNEDYLLPLVIYLVLKTNPPNLWSNYKFIQAYSTNFSTTSTNQQFNNSNNNNTSNNQTGGLTSENIYDDFFTTFSLAIDFIEKLDHTFLSIDYDYYIKHFDHDQKQNLNNNNQNNQNNKEDNSTTTTNTTTTTTNNNNNNVIIENQDINQNNEDLENIKLFKQLNKTQNIIDILLPQLEKVEIEELLLKLIMMSLSKDGSYHASIRYSLKKLFLQYLCNNVPSGGESLFHIGEMEIIGSLQDNHQDSDKELKLLPTTDVNATNNKEKSIKVAKIAGAAVTGALVVGLTGGLAAPFVGSVLGALGAGSLLTGLTATTGVSGATVLSVLFGAAGAKVGADKMISVTSGIQDYSIHKVKTQTSLHAHLYVDGFTTSNTTKERIIRKTTNDFGDIFLLDYEKVVKEKLLSILEEYQSAIAQTVVKSVATNIISTSLAHALIPLSVIKAASVLDNPWSLLKDRSERAGRALALQISQGIFGKRPLTLIGTGMGCRLLFYCLEELVVLAKNNQTQSQDENGDATNNIKSLDSIIENVVFIGSTVPCDVKRWSNLLNFISGRVINCYSPNDLVLKYICRSAHIISDGILPVCGVVPIHIPSSQFVIENVDLSKWVSNFLDYQREDIITKILEHIGINSVNYCLPKIPPRFSGIVYDL